MKTITSLLLLSFLGFSTTQSNKVFYKTIDNKTIYSFSEENLYAVESGMAIDADGAPKAYHKNSSLALDYLGNAGEPGNWWALETDKNGNPLIQTQNDPAPGFYISRTSLIYANKPSRDPNRYINSETVPFIAIPGKFATDFKVGDIALVINKKNGKRCFAIGADVGPRNKIGEGSIFLAKSLGLIANPKKGGASNNIIYLMLKSSGNGKPKTIEEINTKGKELLSNEQVDEVLKSLK